MFDTTNPDDIRYREYQSFAASLDIGLFDDGWYKFSRHAPQLRYKPGRGHAAVMLPTCPAAPQGAPQTR